MLAVLDSCFATCFQVVFGLETSAKRSLAHHKFAAEQAVGSSNSLFALGLSSRKSCLDARSLVRPADGSRPPPRPASRPSLPPGGYPSALSSETDMPRIPWSYSCQDLVAWRWYHLALTCAHTVLAGMDGFVLGILWQ